MKSMIATALLATSLLVSSTHRASAQGPYAQFLNNAQFYANTAYQNAYNGWTAGGTGNIKANAYQAQLFLYFANQYATLAIQADANADFSGATENARLAYLHAYRGARFAYYAYLFSPNETRAAYSFTAYLNAQSAAQQAYIYYILNTQVVPTIPLL